MLNINTFRRKYLSFLPLSDKVRGSLKAVFISLICSTGFILSRGDVISPPDTILTFLICLATFLLLLYIRQRKLVNTSHTNELLLPTTMILCFIGIKVIQYGFGTFNANSLYGTSFLFIAPVAYQALLSSAFLGPRISILGITSTCLLYMIPGNKPFPLVLMLTAWGAGVLCAYFIHPLKRRGDVVKVMAILGAYLSLIAIFLSINPFSSIKASLDALLWAVVTTTLAVAIFELGLVILEKAFGIIGEWSFLELCSPDHPLLHTLCLRAPGTYAHSIIVGNLVENAAREVGISPVLCRAMAYYHDIGKMIRPHYFTENQFGPNLHDQLPPRLSTIILLSHIKEGLRLAKKYKLPQPIIDAITQHHGTSLIKFFYDRALRIKNNKECYPEYLFRYLGPKPQTPEIAILHLADSVEAASRSLNSRSEEALNKLVENIITERIADKQLDECRLSPTDLERIGKSFVTSLCAICHVRIQYPNIRQNETPKKNQYHTHKRIHRKSKYKSPTQSPRGVA